MPKIVDYPRRSLSQSLELAEAVDAVGGTATEEMAADRMGRKGANSGAFAALVGAAVKFGLVENRRSTLSVTPLYRDFSLAYDEEQRVAALRRAFLNVPLFDRICQRFAGKAVPMDILDKLLIREFDVPQNLARRVGEYFVDGARAVQLLSDSGVLTADGAQPVTAPTVLTIPETKMTQESAPPEVVPAAMTHYVVRVTGPGISSSIEIFNEEDLIVVDAVLTRIRKSLQSAATS